MKYICIVISGFLLLQGCCMNFHSKRIIVENDIVKSTKRIKKNFYFNDALEKNSPLLSIKKTVLKEIKENQDTSFTVYDFINLSQNSFPLEDDIYLIMDEEIFPLKIAYKECLNRSEIVEETESILTADSTNVTVTTGYSNQTYKRIKIKYALPVEATYKILDCEKLLFRYYSEPSMISVKLNNRQLRKLKQIILTY